MIADLAINHVERQVLLANYTVDRVLHDYGIDLILKTFSRTGEVEPGQVLIQVKATTRMRRVQGGEFVSIRVSRTDLNTWLHEFWPVILIVYDAIREKAYWLYLQAEWEGRADFDPNRLPMTVTLHIPIGNVLGASAVRKIGTFKTVLAKSYRGVIHHYD